MVGYTESLGAGERDVWLIKTDAFGKEEWNKTFGGESFDEGNSVQQTRDRGYIIAGTKTVSDGSWHIWLIKTDLNGNEEWNKTFGGDNVDQGYSVRQTRDGGYIILGSNTSLSGGFDLDFWLIKTNSSGNVEWNRVYGGSGQEWARKVVPTLDGGYVMIGDTKSFGEGNRDIYLVKTDLAGKEEWSKTYGGVFADHGNSVRQTKDNGYILTGLHALRPFDDGRGRELLWIIKTDIAGNIEWQEKLGDENDNGQDVLQTKDGGYIILGKSGGDIWLIRYDNLGNYIWDKFITGIRGESIQHTTNAGYIISGMTSSYGANWTDLVMVEINTDSLSIVNVDEDDNEFTPQDFSLAQNYPNPFNPTTEIRYSIPQSGDVSLVIYSITGQEIARLVDDNQAGGDYSVAWDASSVSSGIYFYRLQAGDFVQTRKMLLLK